jgi:DNA repair protein RadC
VYVNELKVSYQRRRVPHHPALAAGKLRTPVEAAAVFGPLLRNQIVEVCGLLCLSTRLDVLAYHELSRGSLQSTIVHPRDVFRTALLATAASVIVAHNHPSGDVQPSPEDRAVTQQLVQAGQLLGIDLADHLIVGMRGNCYSFREFGHF